MNSETAVEALSALANPGRLAVFQQLVRAGSEGLAAGEVARLLNCPATTLSTQLAILSRAGLIRSRRDGRSIIYQADYGGVSALIAFLVEDCCGGRPELCGDLARVMSTSLACAGQNA
jgi:DNA-binding transcriptional ArsR family regulator